MIISSPILTEKTFAIGFYSMDPLMLMDSPIINHLDWILI